MNEWGNYRLSLVLIPLVKKWKLINIFLYQFCIICILLFSTDNLKAQDDISKLKLGFNYGRGSQSEYPYDNPNYMYKNKYFKVQINYLLQQRRNWRFEFLIEPSLYISDYKLLNEYFIQPDRGSDYLEQRIKYTQLSKINEYALNFGIIPRYEILSDFSIYVLLSIGPMISDTETERLAKGFAFSDIAAVGLSYKVKRILFDLRLVLRHNSNANLQFPNNGHNSSNIECGFSIEL